MPDPAASGLVTAASTWLLTYVLHSTVVVGTVWCLVRSGRVRRPTTLDLLWKVALVASLATASLAVVRPVRGISRKVEVEIRGAVADGPLAWRSAAAEPGALVIQATALAPTPACREAVNRVRANPRAGAAAVRQACRAPRGGLPWRRYLVGTWLLGAAVLLTRTYFVRRGLRQALRSAYPASELRLDVGEHTLPTGRPVEVLVSPVVDAPCVVGGRVVLPERCARELTPEQIRAVLAHEVAHLVRRDPAWITFGDLVCRAFWLQPVNRIALDGLRDSAELACDDWAVDRTRRPVELAHSIARVAEWVHPVRRMQAPALAHLARLAHGEGRALSKRVRRLLTREAVRTVAPRPLRLLLAFLVVAPTLAVPAVPRASAVYAIFVRAEDGAAGSAPFTDVRAEDVVLRVREVEPGGS